MTRDRGRMFALGSATLLFEVLLTRVAAVTLFANLAFGVIAVSLLGLAVGSAWSERSAHLDDAELEVRIRRALVGAGAAVIVAAVLGSSLPLVPDALVRGGHVADTFVQRRRAFETDPGQVRWGLIALVALAQSVPFGLAGYAQAHLLRRGRGAVGALYAADLAGATAGALAALGVLRVFGAVDALGVVSVVFVVAAVLGSRPPRRDLAAAGAVAIAGAFVAVSNTLEIRHAAGYSEDHIVAVDWSALARIGLFDASGERLAHPSLVVDNTSTTEVAFAHDRRFDGNLERVPYSLRPFADVLVIGAGGGQEIETALDTAPGRQRHVDAVELAAGEERLMRRYFAGRPDFLLDQPGVDYAIGDGRSFLEMTPRRWGVIQMKEVNFHTFAGQASAAWTPNLLFTTEAIQSQLRHLDPDGVLAINRGLYLGGELEATLQVVATLRDATDALGLDLGPRLVLIDRPRRVGIQRMCVVSMQPLTGAELDAVDAQTAHEHLAVVRSPRKPYPPIEDLVGGDRRAALQTIYDEHGLVIAPLTDDRPFGYQHLPFFTALFGESGSTPHAAMQQADYRFLTASLLALFLVGGGVVFAAMRGVQGELGARAVRPLGVASLLGVGFMLLEVVLVERTSLVLGHPTVGFVTVVTSLLIGLAAGSALSGRVRPEDHPRRALAIALLAIASVLLLPRVPQVLLPALRADLGPALRPWAIGVAYAVGATPLGCLLPSVMREAMTASTASAGACWAANAACSVFGTVAAALLVRTTGFSSSAAIVVVTYAVALGSWLAGTHRSWIVRPAA